MIVVEDGTGLSNAQCYVSVAYLDAWMTERGYTTTKTEQQKEAALVISAKDWIDGQHDFANDKLVSNQSFQTLSQFILALRPDPSPALR